MKGQNKKAGLQPWWKLIVGLIVSIYFTILAIGIAIGFLRNHGLIPQIIAGAPSGAVVAPAVVPLPSTLVGIVELIGVVGFVGLVLISFGPLLLAWSVIGIYNRIKNR